MEEKRNYAILVLFFLIVFSISISEIKATNLETLNLTDSTVFDEVTNTCNASRLKMEIIVNPCVAKDINGKDIEQWVNFSWYGNNPQNTSWIFIYSEVLESGKIEVWNNGTQSWTDVSNKIDFIGSDLLGLGHSYYDVSSVVFQPNQTFETRWTFTPKEQVKEGKWSIFGKKAGTTIADSITQNLYILMDPAWQSSFSDDLIAYYNFEQSSGDLTDISSGIFNGSASTSITRGLPGIIGNAWQLRINDTGKVDIDSGSAGESWNVTVNKNFTFQAWVNYTGGSASVPQTIISESQNEVSAAWAYIQVEADDTLIAQMRTDATSHIYNVDNALNISRGGEWTHVVFTNNESDVLLYINATLVGFNNGTFQEDGENLTISTSTIGAFESGSPSLTENHITSIIDEVGIWNRSLTSTEISDLYNSGSGVTFNDDITPPDVLIIFPASVTYGSLDLPLNFNVTTNENSSAIYSLDGGLINFTMTNPDDGSIFGDVFNATNDSIADGDYTFNVYVNDTANDNENFTESVDFSVDQTIPSGNVTSPTGTVSSLNFVVQGAGTDLNIDSCFFNITDSNINQEVPNTIVSNCTDFPSSVSADGNFFVFWSVNDSGGNLNQSNLSFTVSSPVDIGGGGGGSGPLTVVGKNVSWVMQTETGSSGYTLAISPGGKRNKEIHFINRGKQVVDLRLGCEGELCKFVSFDRDTLSLPAIDGDVITPVVMNIDIDNSIPKGDFLFDIQATDQEQNRLILPVKLIVSTFLGAATEIFDKITGSTKIFGVPIPNFVLAFFFSAITFTIGFFSLGRFKQTGILLSSLGGLLIFVITFLII